MQALVVQALVVGAVQVLVVQVQVVQVAAIPEWISKKQVEKKECRRHHPRIRQAASSSFLASLLAIKSKGRAPQPSEEPSQRRPGPL